MIITRQVWTAGKSSMAITIEKSIAEAMGIHSGDYVQLDITKLDIKKSVQEPDIKEIEAKELEEFDTSCMAELVETDLQEKKKPKGAFKIK